MFCEEIRTKQDFFVHINLLIKCSIQQKIRFNDNVFRNKHCRCNESSLYGLGLAKWNYVFEHAPNAQIQSHPTYV